MSYTVVIREERTYVMDVPVSDPSDAISRAYARIRDARGEDAIKALSPTISSKATVICKDTGDTDGDKIIYNTHPETKRSERSAWDFL